MSIYLLALRMGTAAGLRTLAAPAMVCWAVYLYWLNLRGTWLAFLGNVWARWILTLFAGVELVIDQLPTTSSRTAPVQLGARMVTGALSGAATRAGNGALVGGLVAGIIGAVIGTAEHTPSAHGSRPPSATTGPRPSLRTPRPSVAPC